MPPRKTAATTPAQRRAAMNPGGSSASGRRPRPARAGAARRSAGGRVLEAELRTGQDHPRSRPRTGRGTAGDLQRSRTARPKARPASRNSGDAGSCHRPAMRASTASPTTIAPSSSRNAGSITSSLSAGSPRGLRCLEECLRRPACRPASGAGRARGRGSGPHPHHRRSRRPSWFGPRVADGPARNGDPSPIESRRSPGPRPVGADGPGPRRREVLRPASVRASSSSSETESLAESGSLWAKTIRSIRPPWRWSTPSRTPAFVTNSKRTPSPGSGVSLTVDIATSSQPLPLRSTSCGKAVVSVDPAATAGPPR